ncbi:uncharacterized protein si:ch211-266a5.12 isoform X2 [Megalops cyprinoides]|uniref:uncharacterized protein si:ch211-266a5.12 isoform X2 n=1 Tax=Megalops cyprinoides TaxID=118141 RepID=UPI001864FADA|nr:uncharacterized protein si:ch211-266a5.12 isoform X2 [Megalops cyprinoides]
MSGHLPCTVLLAVLLARAELKPASAGKWARCGQSGRLTNIPCMDHAHWYNLTANLGEGITSHDDSILVGPSTFDKIRGSHLQGCVLKKIFQFYDQVLYGKGGNYTDLQDFIAQLNKCVLRVCRLRRCRKLYQEAQGMSMDETRRQMTLTAKEVAMLQIHKLQHATKQIGDMRTQEKAIIELRTLEFYLPEEKMKNDKGKPKCTVKSQRN